MTLAKVGKFLIGQLLPALCWIGVMMSGAPPLPAWNEETESDSARAESSLEEWLHLAGNWDGYRTQLEANGLTFEFVNTLDLAKNFEGGIERDACAMDKFEMKLTLDTTKAGLWDDGTFFICGIGCYSDRLLSEKLVGDLQVASNIEAPEGMRLYEAWYEHRLLKEKLNILLGQHDLNSELLATEYGGLFLNSSFGIQAECAGAVPVSIFPQPALGLRLQFKPVNWFEFRTALYDGDPGDAAGHNRHGVKWRLSSEDGAMMVGEIAFHLWQGENAAFLPGALKLGAWRHTADLDDVREVDVNGDPVQHDENFGIYFIVDQALFREDREKDDQGLSLFWQLGGVPKDRNEVDFYLGAGLHYKGLIPTRDEDEFGIALAYAHISKDSRQVEERDRAETTIEVTYRAKVLPWLAIQPDLQFVFDPGAEPDVKDAVVGMLRIVIDF